MKKNQIIEVLENMSMPDLVQVHNEYCNAANYPDNWVYSMEEFDEIMSGSSPWEIARTCFYGDFRPCDDWFTFNGYANIDTFDYLAEENCPIYIDDIASYILENEDSLNNGEIEEILNEETEG